jgi:EAL and modified HD-GYP domain-containing signal transduction protein
MDKLYISKQKIFDTKNRVFAYELLFKDSFDTPQKISNNIKKTSQLIVNSISGDEIDKLLEKNILAFIDIDENTLERGILDILDKNRFVLNISANIELQEQILTKIIQYKKRGFKISLEYFDSSTKMIIKFQKLFNYIDFLKMDILTSEQENLEKIVQKFKGTHIKLLAQNIETKNDYIKYLKIGFDYFQGYYLDKPQMMELNQQKEPTQVIILQLINIIKQDKDDSQRLENFIKQQPDLSFKLIQFFNNLNKLDTKITSLKQVITLMGRNQLLRWLIVYLYSEVSTNPASETLLELAIKRAKSMEKEADIKDKDKAYIAGMFSMLDSIFETDIKELMKKVEMDKDIVDCVVHKKGRFASSLMRAEIAEKKYLRKIMLANFDKLNTKDIIYTLEDGGINLDKDKF